MAFVFVIRLVWTNICYSSRQIKSSGTIPTDKHGSLLLACRTVTWLQCKETKSHYRNACEGKNRMHAKHLVIAVLLCLGLLGACTGSDTQKPPPAQAGETDVPGILHDQFKALDKAKTLQNKLQQEQAAQQRQFEDRPN